MRKVSIIGAGRLGGALALALARNGYRIENLCVKNREKALEIAELIDPQPRILDAGELFRIDSELIFIATRDAEIEDAARILAAGLRVEKPFVFHTSGAQSSEILLTLQKVGARVGSIHPLVSISDARTGADSFKNSYFCVEGDAGALGAAEQIVADLGGRSFTVETRFKTLYHAAAVTACGHLIALVDVALEMLQKCGPDEATAQRTLLPLIRSVVDNLARQTAAEALTGPFARADVKTFERHLESLIENVSDTALAIYLQLADRSVELARRQGANPEKLTEMREKISLAKKNFKC